VEIFYIVLQFNFVTNTTLKKIAETLGCSISTVSRALKHHPDISVKTREKVLELANTLDYEPNAFAVHLRTQNSQLIGIMVPAISNYFYESFITAIEEESRKNGYSVMILQTDNNPAIEAENARVFRQNRVRGVFACISAETQNIDHFTKLSDLEIPVIYFDKVPNIEGVNKVCLADERAGVLAAEFIAKANKKRIVGIFGDPRLSITEKRLATFKSTLESISSKISLTVLHANNSADAAIAINKALSQSKKPDALFCMSDELLIGAMKAIQLKEIKIPSQLGVISISNGFIPKLYHPEITYVETSGYKLGKLAFTHILACIKQFSLVQELTLESALVEGGSI
jgi:LacI family transcriptional regulator